MGERIQKLIASAGLCSRRTAEQWIADGRVTVNGERAQIGQSAEPDGDLVCVDGKPIEPVREHRYLLLNKPRGYVTTLHDERGRPTVAELVRSCGVRVYPVGRLDLDSEGLLLLTNDGVWMQKILHPRYEINKIYHVTVAGDVQGADVRLASLREIEGETICPAEVKTLRSGRETAELEFIIHQGKNRQIRRMCAACNLHVKKLKRVQEHKLLLGDLKEGEWRDLTREEILGFED